MFQRTAVLGLVVAVGALAPLGAQQPGVTPEQQQAQLQARFQIQIFESVLQRAVRNGGIAFAKEHADFIPPGLELTSADAQVVGLVPPQPGTLMFYVQVPVIREVLMADLLVPRPPRGGRPGDPLQQTANAGRSGAAPAPRAQGLPDADPMTASPVVDNGSCASRVKPTRGYADPDYSYAVAVCDALVDAMLEHSGQLGVKETEWLTIAAVSEPDRASVIGTSKKIYLSIKGADLIAYRQSKLTKDEARRRVELKLD